MIYPLILILSSSLSYSSQPKIDVVYGEDNRVEAFERPLLRTESQAVAAMVSKDALKSSTTTGLTYLAATLKKEFRLCEGEKFAEQPTLAECSGFLVAPDVLMTAGHCVRNQSECQNYRWVFGYEMNEKIGLPGEILKQDVYQCSSIISRSYGNGIDYAIIKLDRKSERTPLKLAEQNEIPKPGTDIMMMGYPSGLPLKITDGAQILGLERHRLITNLDAFHVNSGSPVFDVKTNTVIGILVSGAEDYESTNDNCMIVNEMNMKDGEEAVTSLHIVPRKF